MKPITDAMREALTAVAKTARSSVTLTGQPGAGTVTWVVSDATYRRVRAALAAAEGKGT